MKEKPTYDLDWFDKHAPFRKILEETCDLQIEKTYVPHQVFGSIWSKHVHFDISVNKVKFCENFDIIQNKILNTRVCKHNKEIYEWVNDMSCSKKALIDLIVDGCLVYQEASFAWHWVDN